MSLRGNIRKLAVVTAVVGAVVAVPTAAVAGGHHASGSSSSASLESGSAGVGLFGPHANWLNAHQHEDEFEIGG
ncbi:hypothetical protein ACFYUY_25550 [Kitasatospora sp. NPDC004745]|uniref:hypothetical protein n=1 Tax=unclassified Kitasatospora TaxID=2633591 RepID=UPI0033C35167